ncbi:MAG: hypothetical protein IJ399_02145 [Bacilli bacterium]|nr:hypothetical protein [Bacilli bacterium]
MKKKLILFLMIMFLPYVINASEKCTIVSGNGKDIGSEIDCAGEHFYVIEDKEDSVRMLSKYNLDVGYEYNKVIITEERYNEIKELCLGSSYCKDMFNEDEFKGYTNIRDYNKNEDNSYIYYIYREIDSGVIKQNYKAIGAHGDEKGNPEFPEYGILSDFLYHFDGSFDELFGSVYGNKTFIDYDVHLSDFTSNDRMSIFDIMSSYKDYLNKNGSNVISFDMMSVKELNNLTLKLTNKNLPLEEWAMNIDEWEEREGIETEYYIVGSIKEFLPQGYEWIYNTTYWTKTGIPFFNSDGSINYNDSSDYMYFVDTLGNLCNAYGCEVALGAGVRPIIEIDKDSIKYNVVLPEEETKGSVEIVENENENLVSFRVFPKNGYKFEGVTLITESGEKIELTEKDIVVSDDGIMTISEDKFKMGYENVRLEVKWGEDIFNPKTGVKNIIGLMFTIMLVLASGLFIIKNYNKSLEI